MYASTMEFSKAEWVAKLNEKLGVLIPQIPTGSIVIQYEIVDDSHDSFFYHLFLGGSEAAVQEGKPEQADVTFSIDQDTAALIQEGSLSTEEAFLRGLLAVDGDVALLVNIHDEIEN